MALDTTKNTIVGNLKTLGVLVGIMWAILLLSYLLPLNDMGIKPRTLGGLVGILFAPFLHLNFAHLVGNSLCLIILGSIFLGVEGKRSAAIMLFVILLSGAGTWLIGRDGSVHIGASGLIYGMISYLLFYGIFKRSIGSILISVLVFFLYGGAIWGVFPSGPMVSWEMHLSGFLAGILLAKLSIQKNISATPG